MFFLALAFLIICATFGALVLVVPVMFIYFAVRRTRPPRALWAVVAPWAVITLGVGWMWRMSMHDSLVHNAAVGDDAEVTRLLGWGLDPNRGNLEGELALVAAARAGDTAMITLLVRSGADVNRAERVRDHTATPLQAACDVDTLYGGHDCAHADAAAQLRRLGARR